MAGAEIKVNQRLALTAALVWGACLCAQLCASLRGSEPVPALGPSPSSPQTVCRPHNYLMHTNMPQVRLCA